MSFFAEGPLRERAKTTDQVRLGLRDRHGAGAWVNSQSGGREDARPGGGGTGMV